MTLMDVSDPNTRHHLGIEAQAILQLDLTVDGHHQSRHLSKVVSY